MTPSKHDKPTPLFPSPPPPPKTCNPFLADLSPSLFPTQSPVSEALMPCFSPIPQLGALNGGSPMPYVDLRNGNASVSVAYIPHCHMWNLRKGYVPCHYIFTPHVACHYALWRMPNLRNAYVALSILGVKGRQPPSPMHNTYL